MCEICANMWAMCDMCEVCEVCVKVVRYICVVCNVCWMLRFVPFEGPQCVVRAGCVSVCDVRSGEELCE